MLVPNVARDVHVFVPVAGHMISAYALGACLGGAAIAAGLGGLEWTDRSDARRLRPCDLACYLANKPITHRRHYGPAS